jgi:signal peptidase I
LSGGWQDRIVDFALILVVATAATGLIWAFDALILKPMRKDASSRESILVEYSRSFFPILLLVLVLRSFLFEPFRIPSGSMMPTLLEGDFIFVNKFAYGLRLPVVNTRFVGIGEPAHGDVVVFRLPSDPSVNYIKRVVGLPGDVVEYNQGNKQLTINGELVPIELDGPYADDPGSQLAREWLGEREHMLLLTRGRISSGGTYVVPEGHFFMMGDNRDQSQDSRFMEVGFVPEDLLVGRAVRIWMNWRRPSDGGPRWERIGRSIH